MAEREIIIPITLAVSESGEGGNVETLSTDSQLPQNEQDKKSKQKGKDASDKANPANAIIAKAIGETLSLALNNLGDITGNYVEAQNIQAAVSEGAKIGSAIQLGPAGLAIYAIDKTVQGYNYIASIKKSEKQAAFAQKRVFGTTTKS